MLLLTLLIVPVIIGFVGWLLGKGKITWKELAVQEAVSIAVIGIGYAIALHAATSDTELLNSSIVNKWKDSVHCCHSYRCFCHQSCSGSGKDKSCHEVCSTCYYHSQDIRWQANNGLGEIVYSNSCNSPGSNPPARWSQIIIGEPTASEHTYVNYIQGNPDAVMKREGVPEKFEKKIPDYPKVYDFYRANRFIAVGLSIPGLNGLNQKLSEINARLGPTKQVNIIVVVVNEKDQKYLNAFRESWIGGKKNDFIVILGAPEFPKISWAGVVSWTKNEKFKEDLRVTLLENYSNFDGDKILSKIETEVKERFERRHMAEFEYLKDTIEPSKLVCWLLFIFGCLIAIGLQIFFWKNDCFGQRSY